MGGWRNSKKQRRGREGGSASDGGCPPNPLAFIGEAETRHRHLVSEALPG